MARDEQSLIACVFTNSVIFRAHMSLLYPSLSTPTHTSSTSPTTWRPTVNHEQTCAPLLVQSIGSMADMDAPTGYEPNQFTEPTAINPQQSLFHELIMIYGNAESVESHPLDLEISYEQSTDLLTSPLFFTGARSKCTPIASLSLSKRKHGIRLVQTSIHTERPVASCHSDSERNFKSILEEQRQRLL